MSTMTLSTDQRFAPPSAQARGLIGTGRCLLPVILLLALVSSASWGTISPPLLKGVEDHAVSLWETPPAQGLSLAYPSVPALTVSTKGLRRDVGVDPENWIITFAETVHGLELKTPLIYDLNTFVRVKADQDLIRLLQEERSQSLSSEEGKGGAKRGGINIDIPVKFPKALTRIIGEGGGLKITGYRKISFSGRSEWTEGDVLTATHRPSKFPSLVMEQRSQFKIEGTIGEKIHVYVDQDTERMTDLENAIRINYKGSEDEIIQEIQAGNTSLSLPQTQFVSFSQKNKGLFGIKATAKLGPLDIVAIASQDKGAGQRKSFQAGAESRAQQIRDYNYKRGYYFFLDSVYVANYERYSEDWVHLSVEEGLVIDSLEVFIDDGNVTNNAEDGTRPARAVVDPLWPDSTYGDRGQDENYIGDFRLLDLDEYYVDRQLGYIVLNTPMRDDWVLAVTYKPHKFEAIPGAWVGHYVSDPALPDTSLLKLIRPRNPRPGQETWELEWKNVYDLRVRDIPEEGLDVKIYFDESGEEDDDSQEGTKYITIMGLDKFDNQNNSILGPDKLVDSFDPAIINLARGELIFPALRPFDTDFDFGAGTLKERVPKIYDEPNKTTRQQATRYYIAVESQTRQVSYNLGMNVIEGSEVVKLNGRTLQRNKDYNIIYEVGTITFLTDEALDPTAEISVDYEYAPFFMPERKTLLGVRGEYSFSNDASWGATILYRSESRIDRRIRLGQEPTRAIVWDSDLQLNFQPQILTDMVDALPFMRTNAPSALKISGEIAQSLPNSNTKGDAYVDDFDGSKNTTSLGVMRGQWTVASPPTMTSPYDPNDARHGRYSIRSRWSHFYWYNPYEQVDVNDIWPEKKAYRGEGRTHVLSFDFTPNDSGAHSWAGVMRALSQGNFDQSRSKYIEVWVNGSRGQINIDLGLISEDVIPNNRLDSEDRGADIGRGDGLLDLDEDVGLDGMADSDSIAIAAGGDFWDVDGDGEKDDWEPYSNDAWSYESGSSDYDKINGTEANRNDPDRGIRPDTEDINGKSGLDTDNRFFRYSFSLDKDSPDTVYVAGGDLDRSNWGLPTSWRLYRIPLAEPDTATSGADMTDIQFVRIWITGVDRPTTVRFAAIDIVGNDWLEDGIVTGQGRPYIGDEETFAVTVKNTHDNPDDYTSPPGVTGVRDVVTNLEQMEQSLVLKFENLAPGHSGSASQVSYGQSRDFTKYRTLRMYVYGDIHNSAGPDTGVAQFFFRFGADTSNFYEYRTMIYPGWDERNEVRIDFDELTNLKYQQLKDGRAKADTISGNFRIYGSPSLSDIRHLTVGVKNVTYPPRALKAHNAGAPLPRETISGEVWVDELRLTDARDDPGLAGRVTVDATLADLGRITVNLNRVDAEFQSLGAGSRSDSQKSSKSSQSVQGNLSLNKFLPERWGVSLPLSGSYSKTTQLPKLRKGSDVNLTQEEQWAQRTEQTSKSGRIGFSKKPSSFWLLGLTLDRIKLSASGSEKEGRSTTNPYSLSRQMSGSFSYNLSLKKDLFLSPLGWTASKFVPKFISGTRLTVIPSSFSFDTNISQTRSQSVDRHGAVTTNFSRRTTQKFSGSMKPFGSVSANFSLNRSLDSQRAQVTRLKFGRETDRTQSVSLSYKPPFLAWLGPNYSLRVNYHDKENSKVVLDGGKFGRNADNSVSHSAGASLNLSDLLISLGAPKKGEEVGLLSPRRVLGALRMVTDRFQSISGSFQKDRRSNWFNLVGRPTLEFQLGLSTEPGVETDSTLTGQTNTSSSGQSWSAKSGVNFIAGVNVNTSVSSDYKSSISSTGQSDSRTLTFPQISTRWGGLGKLFLFKKLVQSSSLDFGYTQKKTEEGTPGLSQLYSKSISKNFSPLLSWSATWAKNLSSTLTSNRSYAENTNIRQGNTVTTQTSSSLRASIKYSFSAPQGIKLPLFGKVKFQSNLNLNLDFKLDHTKSETKGVPNPVTKDDRTRSVTLGGSYSFSRKVKGGLKIEVSDRYNRKTDRKQMIRDVGLWTEIRFD